MNCACNGVGISLTNENILCINECGLFLVWKCNFAILEMILYCQNVID